MSDDPLYKKELLRLAADATGAGRLAAPDASAEAYNPACGDRITIDYEEAPALDLPAGSRSFIVAKTALLKDITVGERVRFRLDSQQVSALAPFDGDRSQLSDGTDPRGAGGGQPGRFGGFGPRPAP